MKKITSVLLVLMLLPCLFIQAFAEAPASQSLIQTGENGTTYALTVLENGGVMKSYQNAEQTTLSATAILADVGMDEEQIERLSTETVQNCENAESIVSVTTYSKTSADGTTTYLSREETLSEIASSRAVVLPPIGDMGGDAGGGKVEATYNDAYMKITLTIIIMGNGKYHMLADAVWLTMPSDRNYDSIGIAAQDCTLINNTRQGNFSYDCIEHKDGETTTSSKTEYFTDDNFRNAYYNSWAGSGAVFSLPCDESSWNWTHVDYDTKTYTNLKAYFEMQVVLSTPGQEHYFNANATYDHVRYTLDLDLPSISLSIPVPSLGIGISIAKEKEKDTRTAELDEPIHYVPIGG